jgi:hypothetical protein
MEAQRFGAMEGVQAWRYEVWSSRGCVGMEPWRSGGRAGMAAQRSRDLEVV